MLDLKILESKLDLALSKETKESLNKWLRFLKLKKEKFAIISKILITDGPYDVSQFGQLKYGVYVIKGGDDSYYLGDIREFTKAKGPSPYMSYLDLNRVVKKNSSLPLIEPNPEVADIIDVELNKNFLSKNLMDNTITFRKKLEKDFGVII